MTGWYTKGHIIDEVKEVKEVKESSSQIYLSEFIILHITIYWTIWSLFTLLLFWNDNSNFSLMVVTLIFTPICVALVGFFNKQFCFFLALMLSVFYISYTLIVIVIALILALEIIS